MEEEINNILRKALNLKNKGCDIEAVDLLQKTEKEYGPSSKTTGLIAMILYYNLKRTEDSLEYSLKWTELSPNSEKASLHLVHVLFDLDKNQEVENEIRRFVKTGMELNDYNILFEENGLSKQDFI